MTQAFELNQELLQPAANESTEPAALWFGVKLFDLVALLTVFSMFRISHLPLDMALTVAAAILVCLKSVRRSPWFWFGIVVAWLPRMYFDFQHYEDHCFFVIYWCGAMGLAVMGRRVEFSMRNSARLMIGLCFALGCIWKVISPEFYDGSLFHFKLLFDYRFEEMVTGPIGGLSSLTSASNLESYRNVRMALPGGEAAIEIPGRVTWIAYVMTVWTIVIEGALAWAFLFSGKLAERSRDFVLMFFMLSTYFVVPVMGFASIFMTLGIAQTRSNRMRVAYVGTHLLLFAWYTFRMG